MYNWVNVFECFTNIQKLKQCKKNETTNVITSNFFANAEDTEFFLKNWKLINLEK